ncbi:MAG: HIRAN domain-containing protein [Bacteroidales bacterium]
MSEGLIKVTPGLLSLIAGKHNIPMPFQRDILVLEIHIAGTSYRENIDEVEPSINAGQMFRMIREPDNPYDDWAIAVYSEEYKLGFVPRDRNEVIARLMDAGKFFYCKLISKEWKNDWLCLVTEVYMKE